MESSYTVCFVKHLDQSEFGGWKKQWRHMGAPGVTLTLWGPRDAVKWTITGCPFASPRVLAFQEKKKNGNSSTSKGPWSSPVRRPRPCSPTRVHFGFQRRKRTAKSLTARTAQDQRRRQFWSRFTTVNEFRSQGSGSLCVRCGQSLQPLVSRSP